MVENNTPEKLSDEVPKNLLDLVRAEDTALEIARICFENEIKEDEKIREISYQVGRVLLGDLSPKEFPKILEEKAKLTTFLARKIAREINESIFYPVKESLATLYKEEVIPSEKPSIATPEATPPEEKPKVRRGPDVYREPIE